MSELRSDYFGYSATCAICGRTKKPVGRSVPMEMEIGMCSPYHEIFEPRGCRGYHEEPLPSNLFPGESEADFGYRVSR